MKTEKSSSTRLWLKLGVAVLLVAVFAGLLAGWWFGRPPEAAGPAVEPSAAVTASNTGPNPAHPVVGLPEGIEMVNDAGPAVADFRQPDTSATVWETQLDEIVLGKLDPTNKVLLLADLLRTSPTFGKAEVAQYLAGMVSDAQYGVAREILTNAEYPEAVYRPFLNNLISRPDSLKLPVLMEIVVNEEHPGRAQAGALLEYLFSAENATNAEQWRAAVDARLEKK